MFGVLEIERMSLEERLQTMELLWGSLSKNPEQISSPEWHKDVISARLDKIKQGKASFLTIEQAKARLSDHQK